MVRKRSFLSLGPHDFHRVAYTEWGDPERAEVLICVHGLTRNGRDFDHLAAALEPQRRVVCPDVAGRGESDWLALKQDYAYATYCPDMAALMARLGGEAVDWVGTSMGGLIGLMLAAQPGTPIRRLVLNDVGPFVPKAALERILSYAGTDPRFESIAQLEAYLREVHAPFGALTDEQWAHLARHGARALPEGGYALAYDPGIVEPLKAAEPDDLALWDRWDRIACPVLVLRGSESDLLHADVVAEMRRRGPPTDTVGFEAVGHAPMLMDPGQIEAVREWLLAA